MKEKNRKRDEKRFESVCNTERERERGECAPRVHFQVALSLRLWLFKGRNKRGVNGCNRKKKERDIQCEREFDSQAEIQKQTSH